jgi:7,8-dihydro-6-hydroxymethylpterin dimethyltransferase
LGDFFLSITVIIYCRKEVIKMEQFITETTSLCPNCLQTIKARVFENNEGNIWLKKKCSLCGSFSSRCIEKDAGLYHCLKNTKKSSGTIEFRKIAIPITHTCNLKCNMCYDAFIKKEDPSIQCVKELIDAAHGTWIKITGGEPTLREELPEIIRYLHKKNEQFTLVTNGLRLADYAYAKKLRQCGLKRVAFSFSGFDDRVYEAIRGVKLLKCKKKALRNLKRLKMEVVLSVTIVRGVNEKELKPIYRYYLRNKKFVKSLRIRSMSRIGRYMEQSPFVLSELLSLVSKATGLNVNDLISSYESVRPFSNCTCRFEIDVLKAFKNRVQSIKNNFFYIRFLFVYLRLFGILSPSRLKQTPIHLRVWPDKESVDLEEIKSCLTGIYNGDGHVQPFCYYNILQSQKN